jgi:hypothetical protein
MMGTLARLGDSMESLVEEGQLSKVFVPLAHKIRGELYQLDHEFQQLQTQNGIMRELIIEGIKRQREEAKRETYRP